MSTTFLFDILEERLKCLENTSDATVPLRVVHFLRFLWNIVKAFFKRKMTVSYVTQYDYLFIPQEKSWDCGIACCNMVIRWCDYQRPLLSHSVAAERPLWTIELLELLREASVDASMFTVCKGVNPEHSTLSWYANSNESEKERTRDCFERARQENWPVFEKPVDLQLLKTIACESDNAVIILVDANILYKHDSDDYSGHYIVLMDYLSHTDEFVCLNPALRSAAAVLVSSERLQRARMHSGTDQDLLVCRNRPPPPAYK